MTGREHCDRCGNTGRGIPQNSDSRVQAEIEKEEAKIANDEGLNLNNVEDHIKARTRVYENRPDLYAYHKFSSKKRG